MAAVLDASVVAEFLIRSEVGQRAADEMAAHDGDLHLPHLAVVEVTSVLRRWVQRGELSEQRAGAALADLADLPAERWPGEPMLDRMWALRANVTAYDACYAALAEMLDAELLTTDLRLVRGLKGLASCRVTALTAEP